jgi:hypothetical protein
MDNRGYKKLKESEVEKCNKEIVKSQPLKKFEIDKAFPALSYYLSCGCLDKNKK